jgi:hypothetical protein
MAEHGHKIVYLLVERSGTNGFKKTYWRPLGAAYGCRDGSLNVKLDIHPGLTFNIRDPKSLGEREETQTGNQSDDLPGNSLGNSFENDFSDAFNDETFVCNDCRQEKPNDEAYAVYNGGAVCEDCGSESYKSCGRCEYYFPKSIRGTHCPKCSGSNSSKGGGR